MKRMLIVTFFVSTAFGMQKQQELPSTLMQLNQRLQDLEYALKNFVQTSGLSIFQQLEDFSKLLDTFYKNPSEEIMQQVINQLIERVQFEEIEQANLDQMYSLKKILNEIFTKIENINDLIKNRHLDDFIKNNFYEHVLVLFKQAMGIFEQDFKVKNQKFQDQKVLDESKKISLAQPIQKQTVDIFQQLENFSKSLDGFAKFPSDKSLDQLIEKFFSELTLEGFEQFDLLQLRKLKSVLSNVYEKIVRINQNMKNRGVAMSTQEEFNGTLYMAFKEQKEVMDAYIDHREFQQTLFDQSINNVRNLLIKFQQEPTVLTVSRLANALKFNIRFLDVIDRVEVLFQISLKFNQLVKDIENTFYYPNKSLQDMVKKVGREAWIKKYKKEIFDSLHETQQKLREYLKNRIEAAPREKMI